MTIRQDITDVSVWEAHEDLKKEGRRKGSASRDLFGEKALQQSKVKLHSGDPLRWLVRGKFRMVISKLSCCW